MAGNPDWSVQGDYFEACTCDVACPCIFLMPPSKGHCEALVAWNIKKGHLDKTKLDGLNVAVWLRSPGVLTDGNWKLALYIDDKANPTQRDALENIFGGKLGGHPAVLGGFVTDLLGVKSAPIEFKIDGKKRHLVIKGVADCETFAIDGEDGGDVKVTNHPLAVAPGNALTICKSTKVHYKDHGVDWSVSNQSSLSAPFQYKP